MSTRLGAECAVIGALMCAGFFCDKALAEDCKPLALIASVDLVPAGQKTAEFVPVEIQGKPKLMLLDTGGGYTEITGQTVDELGLQRRRSSVRSYDVAGNYSDQFAEASLKLGGLTANKVAFVVAEETLQIGKNELIGGILAPDILKHYDVSIDFGADKLSLLSQDHCEGKVVYWPATAVAVVPMRVLASGHIVVSVMLDGHATTAILDTGATRSTLKQPAAESDFGLKLGSADTPHSGELLGQAGTDTYRHTFKSLAFEGIAVNNLSVEIIPDRLGHLLGNRPEIGTLIADPKYSDVQPEMLIGMDVLKHLRLYIAYKEEKLYITAAGEPASPSAPNGAPPAGN